MYEILSGGCRSSTAGNGEPEELVWREFLISGLFADPQFHLVSRAVVLWIPRKVGDKTLLLFAGR